MLFVFLPLDPSLAARLQLNHQFVLETAPWVVKIQSRCLSMLVATHPKRHPLHPFARAQCSLDSQILKLVVFCSTLNDWANGHERPAVVLFLGFLG
jgi:hypothetical protein